MFIGADNSMLLRANKTVLAERRTLLPLTATSTGDRGGGQVVPSSIGTSLSSSASTDRTITTIATTKLAIQQQHGDEGQEEDQQHKDAEVPQMRQLRKRTKVVYTPMPKRQRASAAAAGKKSAARSRSCKESSLLHKELIVNVFAPDAETAWLHNPHIPPSQRALLHTYARKRMEALAAAAAAVAAYSRSAGRASKDLSHLYSQSIAAKHDQDWLHFIGVPAKRLLFDETSYAVSQSLHKSKIVKTLEHCLQAQHVKEQIQQKLSGGASNSQLQSLWVQSKQQACMQRPIVGSPSGDVDEEEMQGQEDEEEQEMEEYHDYGDVLSGPITPSSIRSGLCHKGGATTVLAEPEAAPQPEQPIVPHWPARLAIATHFLQAANQVKRTLRAFLPGQVV